MNLDTRTPFERFWDEHKSVNPQLIHDKERMSILPRTIKRGMEIAYNRARADVLQEQLEEAMLQAAARIPKEHFTHSFRIFKNYDGVISVEKKEL